MIPFPLATTLNEARDNALHLARMALDAQNRQEMERLCTLAEVWTSIAQTFPPAQAIDSLSDQTAVIPTQTLGRAWESDTTLVVDAVAWNVLSVLAARYVSSSMTRTATVDLREIHYTGELRFIRGEDPSTIQVMLESPRD